ncbi:hypothetical protein ACNSO7_12360, partial [Yersinia enterocolitica]
QSQGNIHAAIRLGLDTLQGFFNGNPRGLSERDARILGRAFLLLTSACRKICRLSVYVIKLKAVISDYEWITYGEWAINQHDSLTVVPNTGGRSGEDNRRIFFPKLDWIRYRNSCPANGVSQHALRNG